MSDKKTEPLLLDASQATGESDYKTDLEREQEIANVQAKAKRAEKSTVIMSLLLGGSTSWALKRTFEEAYAGNQPAVIVGGLVTIFGVASTLLIGGSLYKHGKNQEEEAQRLQNEYDEIKESRKPVILDKRL